jgi:hypothetical protein
MYTITANDGTPHVVFPFQNIPVLRRMNLGRTNGGGYALSEMTSCRLLVLTEAAISLRV